MLAKTQESHGKEALTKGVATLKIKGRRIDNA
jgi:hypothetical protein